MNQEITSLILVEVLMSQLERLGESHLTHREKDGAMKLMMLQCEELKLKIQDEQYVLTRKMREIMAERNSIIARIIGSVDAIRKHLKHVNHNHYTLKQLQIIEQYTSRKEWNDKINSDIPF